MRRTSWVYAIIAILLSASAAQAQFTFQGIGGSPAPSLISVANGVSGDGRIVIGGDSVKADFWTRATGLVGLGVILGGDIRSNGFAASADGSVLVGAGNGGQEAFRWTARSGMVGLGHLPGAGPFFSSSQGVSADGNVVVGFSQDHLTFHAFRWTAATGMTPLGSLGSAENFGVANGVSADGKVIVGETESPAGTEAFRWTAATGMVGLGVLPGALFSSSANAASADGSVIVGTSISAFGREAFRWTSQGGMVGLGDLPGSVPFSSTANAVSADGNVIVGFGNGTGEFDSGTAFLWLPSLGMVDLKSYLLQHGVEAVRNWTLNFANGVSADGRTIVGEGIDPQGLAEGWVAHIDINTSSTETIQPSAFSVLSGKLVSGGLKQLQAADHTYLTLGSTGQNPMQMTVDGQSSQPGVSELDFSILSSAHGSSTHQVIELFDFTSATWVMLDTRAAASTDTTTEVRVVDRPTRFLDPQTLHVRARLTFLPSAKKISLTHVRIDHAFWTRVP